MATRGLGHRSTAAQIDSTQADLFGGSEPPGLSYVADVVTPDEERRLIALIDAQDLAPFRFHAWRGKRLTASFGWSYDYDSASFTPTAAIPDWLLPLRARAARHAAIAADAFVQALLIRYDPGAGIEPGER